METGFDYACAAVCSGCPTRCQSPGDTESSADPPLGGALFVSNGVAADDAEIFSEARRFARPRSTENQGLSRPSATSPHADTLFLPAALARYSSLSHAATSMKGSVISLVMAATPMLN